MIDTIKKHNKKISHPELLNSVKTGNHIEAEKWLKEEGVSPNFIDPKDKNKTALHIACEKGDL